MRLPVAALSLCLLVSYSVPASAFTLAEAVVRELPSSVLCSDGGSGATSASTSCSGDKYFGEARARANPGDLGTYAELGDDGEEFPQSLDYQAFGRAVLSDGISLFSSILQPGELTDVRMIVQLDVGPGARNPPPFTQGGTLTVFSTLTVKINGVEMSSSNGNTFGELWFDFDMSNGGSTSINLELVSDVRCFNCAEYLGISNLFNSATIVEVQALSLTPGAFTVSSDEFSSGYANVVGSVPEPALVLVTTLALCTLPRLRARKD